MPFFSRIKLDMNSSWAEHEAVLRETKVQSPPTGFILFLLP